jgi:hypothetical protein
VSKFIRYITPVGKRDAEGIVRHARRAPVEAWISHSADRLLGQKRFR